MRHSTDTTASTTSAGKPASCMIVIGLPFGRQPEQLAEDLRHGVAADIGVLEHEGVARVVAHRLDARDQPVIVHARRAVLELAHALVDQRDQVGQPIGHRRVDGVAGALRIDLLERQPIGRAAVLRVAALGERDDLGEDLDLLVDARAAAEEDVDDLLEVEQPERQLQVARD